MELRIGTEIELLFQGPGKAPEQTVTDDDTERFAQSLVSPYSQRRGKDLRVDFSKDSKAGHHNIHHEEDKWTVMTGSTIYRQNAQDHISDFSLDPKPMLGFEDDSQEFQ